MEVGKGDGRVPSPWEIVLSECRKPASLCNLPARTDLITRNHDLEADPRSPPYRDSTALQLRPSEEGTEEQGAGTAGRESQKTCKKKRSQN